MSRYIKFDDAVKVMACEMYAEAQSQGYDVDDIEDFMPEAKAWLNDAPSIDIEPKRGEWVKRTHDTLIAQVNFAYCSECGQPIMHEHTRSLWNFCPNCGADMREREGE